jgi:hypothetical protein
MYLFICFYATGRTLKVHLNIIHVVSLFELMHGWGLLKLLVIINYLVLFIEYAYQTLVVYPMLYRYHPILLLYFVILLLYCIVCIHYTLYPYHINHCNDLALNGSLIGNKHICICIGNHMDTVNSFVLCDLVFPSF